MTGVENRTVSRDDDGIRLDRWFKRNYPDLSHGRLEKLLRKGQIRVDGGRAKAAQRVEAGQTVRVPPLGAEPPPAHAAKSASRVSDSDLRDIDGWILHEDSHVLVLNKPAGLPVQGGTGSRRNLDAILAARAGQGQGQGQGGPRPRLVHRLDRDTSGVLVLGKSPSAAAALAAAFRGRKVRKLYWALVVGAPARRRGRIDDALTKRGAPGGEKVAVVDDDGVEAGADVRQAATRYATVDHAGNRIAWLALMPITGRTHQIRVHCAAMGTPIVGDGKYGGSDAFIAGTDLARQLHLHARRLILPHPAGGLIDMTAPLPPHMESAWRKFGFDQDDGDPFDFDTPSDPRRS